MSDQSPGLDAQQRALLARSAAAAAAAKIDRAPGFGLRSATVISYDAVANVASVYVDGDSSQRAAAVLGVVPLASGSRVQVGEDPPFGLVVLGRVEGAVVHQQFLSVGAMAGPLPVGIGAAVEVTGSRLGPIGNYAGRNVMIGFRGTIAFGWAGAAGEINANVSAQISVDGGGTWIGSPAEFETGNSARGDARTVAYQQGVGPVHVVGGILTRLVVWASGANTIGVDHAQESVLITPGIS